jgi:FkbM family methyltransferase
MEGAKFLTIQGRQTQKRSSGTVIGSNPWWLYESRGSTSYDAAILNLIKFTYRVTRFSARIVLGRKRTDELFLKRNLDFKLFLYRSLNFLKLENRVMQQLVVPEYNYQISLPINKEDLVVVTKHEDEIIKYVNPKEGDVFVDVGAHFGRYTLIAAKNVGRSGKVISIEAHPRNFRILKKNVELNRLTNVIALQYAVYSKQMRLKLHLPDEDLGYTMHHSVVPEYLLSKYEQKEKIENNYIEVNADTLDSILGSIGITQVNWIKIDVEGAELEVLKGSKILLANSKDIHLVIEVHGRETYEPVVRLLHKHGMTIEFEKTYDNGERHIIAKSSITAYAI